MEQKYNILITDTAEEDISIILNFLSESYRNPTYVNDFWNEIMESIEITSYFPYSNSVYTGKYINCDDSYRKIIIRQYYIIYRIIEEKREIYSLFAIIILLFI